jgi:hypothetical protein
MLWKVIRKAEEMYYNKMLNFIYRSEMSWIIISNEIATASNKKFTLTDFKLGTKNLTMK